MPNLMGLLSSSSQPRKRTWAPSTFPLVSGSPSRVLEPGRARDRLAFQQLLPLTDRDPAANRAEGA